MAHGEIIGILRLVASHLVMQWQWRKHVRNTSNLDRPWEIIEILPVVTGHVMTRWREIKIVLSNFQALKLLRAQLRESNVHLNPRFSSSKVQIPPLLRVGFARWHLISHQIDGRHQDRSYPVTIWHWPCFGWWYIVLPNCKQTKVDLVVLHKEQWIRLVNYHILTNNAFRLCPRHCRCFNICYSRCQWGLSLALHYKWRVQRLS